MFPSSAWHKRSKSAAGPTRSSIRNQIETSDQGGTDQRRVHAVMRPLCGKEESTPVGILCTRNSHAWELFYFDASPTTVNVYRARYKKNLCNHPHIISDMTYHFNLAYLQYCLWRFFHDVLTCQLKMTKTMLASCFCPVCVSGHLSDASTRRTLCWRYGVRGWNCA